MDGHLKEGNLIEKSKKLVWARFNSYTSGELRLLEVYLSRINPRDPDSSLVTFTLSEYAKLMDLPDLRARDVKPHIDHFLGNIVTIDTIKNGHPAWEKYVLFTQALCEKDDDIGQWVISIDCNPKLQPVFFNLATDGYIRYRLRYTKDMKSQYSIKLYGLLKDWLHNSKGWDITLTKLREQLSVPADAYFVFKDFRKWVLDRAVTEINALSDLKVSYTKITTGRRVTGIHFTATLKPSKKAIEAKAKAASAEHGGNWYAEALGREVSSGQALKIVRCVQKNLADLYPEIPIEKREQAVWDTLHRAYSAQLEEGRDIRDAGAYFYSILKDISALDDYLPWEYCMGR